MSVAAVGYLRIMSQDVDAWMNFATNILGLMDAGREDGSGARYLRMDDHPFRWVIEPGDADKLIAGAFEYRTREDWQAACDALSAAGHSLEAGSEEEAERRCVTEFVSVVDPSGNTSELYYGRKLDYLPFNSPVGVPAFVTGDGDTGDMGFGHFVLPAPETDATVSFYTDLVGMGVCDTLHIQDIPGAQVIFTHADNPRQHSLAMFNGPHPLGVVHIMVEVETMDQVGLAMDRAKAAGIDLFATLGRHVNDNMCSFYIQAPGGIAVEFGYDGLLMDWSNYTPTVSVEGDLWGHEYHFPGVND